MIAHRREKVNRFSAVYRKIQRCAQNQWNNIRLYVEYEEFRQRSIENQKLDKKKTERGQEDKKDHVDGGEQAKIRARLPGVFLRVGAEGDEAREGGDEGACAADIHPEQKRAVIVGKAGEKNGARHVADDLTGKNAEKKRALLEQSGKQLPDRPDAGHVAGEDEKCAECK